MLNGLGYKVLSDDTPKEAIKLAQDHKGKIHLLVTDVIMPEMGGHNLAKEMKELYPETPVIFASGYTQQNLSSDKDGKIDEKLKFVGKPYIVEELAMMFRKELDKVLDRKQKEAKNK